MNNAIVIATGRRMVSAIVNDRGVQQAVAGSFVAIAVAAAKHAFFGGEAA